MDHVENYSVTHYVSPLDTVIRSDPTETLGTVLSLVKTSHSPVFIFDERGHFKGLISPYQALYKHRYPYTTKVGSILFIPPHISNETPLYQVADHMLTTRIYTLPVFDRNNKVIGVVRAKDIFQGMKEDQDFLIYVSKTIVPNNPITYSINGSVEDVYHTMRKEGISRVILTNNEGAVEGIISRSDLMNAFIKPTSKQRFSKNYGDSGYFAFDEEKEYRRDDPIRKYATERVETIASTASMRDMVERLITGRHNSIVITDRNRRPLGFLSTRDLLESVSTLRPEEDTLVHISKPSDAVSDDEMEEAMQLLIRFSKKMQKRIPVEKIDVTFEEPKYPDRQTAMYNTSVILTPKAGDKFVGKTQRKIFLDSLRAATEQIEKQEQRHSDQRRHHESATL